MHAIPVIDVSPLFEYPSEEDSIASVSKAIADACTGMGFFYCTGHGLSDAQISEAIGAARSLFDLDMQQKQAMNSLNSPLRRGYTPQGGQHNCNPTENNKACMPDAKESYVLGAGPDMPKPPQNPVAEAAMRSNQTKTGGSNAPDQRPQDEQGQTHGTGQELQEQQQNGQGTTTAQSPMYGSNQLPPEDVLPGFQGIMRSYWQQLLRVSQVLALGLAKSLDLPDSFFVSKMQDPVAQMLCVRYNMQAPPSSSGATQAHANPDRGNGFDERLLGCGTHTDCGFMTLLCCDGEGLEVCTPQGTWVAALVIPGALLVNLGDMAAMWTNGRYRSTPHRVLLPRIPPESSSARAPSRVSLVFFCNCDFYAPVCAIESPLTDKGTTAGRYMLEKLGLMYK
ncbi:hypothetical protein DUNSADRAFT_4588 [Dunaliella salina]|uniref:Fe2OG dioxygenase domain-containing protein n=1 Tax=Dunaliella salina TaxID=3046 RepID=A0ABQ7GRR0_DUNSA|nr:hypothetical protein DUNSADRAFT_4588 [Dunaliella salina]|eukprot:KAF5837261.1 hypothetical protein DUNSADRAFT_4588 [Dunaliella salina]